MIWGDLMTPEARFSARVKAGLKICSVERIENRVNLGIPDMLVGVGEKFVLIELKVVVKGLQVKLRPHQIAFMTRHSSNGRPCYILVLDTGTTARPSTIRLYHGRDAMALSIDGLRLQPLLQWPSKSMDWEELEKTLKT
jgi:hypothetical protein